MKARYRRMLKGMAAKAGAAEIREWGVYLLRCGDGTLYTGIAKDVEARLRVHNSGKGAAYTRTRRPVELLHRQGPFTRSEALVCEAWVKRLPRARKEEVMALPLDARKFRAYSVSKQGSEETEAREEREEAGPQAKDGQSQGRRRVLRPGPGPHRRGSD